MYRYESVPRFLFVGLVFATALIATGCETSPGLIYEDNNAVWKMHENGSEKIKLVDNARYPRWVRGVKDQIAFVRTKAGKSAIFVIDYEGKSEKQLTDYNAGEYFSWSPDRSWIAFQSDRDGNWEIYKVNVNTKQEIRLTTDKADDKRPRWSPKGNKIAFESNRRNGDWDIWLMDGNGTALTNVTDGFVGDGFDGRAVWSLDGQNLACICNHVGWGGPKICVIYLTIPAGMGPVSLPVTGGSEPVWDMDGKYIFYIGRNAPNDVLYKLEIATKKSQALSTFSSSIGEFMDADAVNIYYAKTNPAGGYGLYSIKWYDGTESKIGQGINPNVSSW